MTVLKNQKDFNFSFSFKTDKPLKQNGFDDCIYCKHKDIEIKKLKDNNEKIKKIIIDKDEKIFKLEEYIKSFISLSQKHNINNIDELKNFIKDKSQIIIDDLMYIDFDIFQYECNYSLVKQIEDYEEQLDTIDNILKSNNINSFSDFKAILSKSNLNLSKKYDSIFTILDKADENIKSNNIILNELINNYNNLDIRIKNFKNKLSKIKEGDIIITKGIKRKAIYINGKLKLCKIENVINKIKMLEEEFNSCCNEQIKWAKSVLSNDINDDKLIKILDLYNKLTNNKIAFYSSESESESNNKYYNILNENKNLKILEFETYSKLGKQFIDDKINSQKDLSNEDLLFIKEIVKTSDIKSGSKDDKINRFINTCKRYFILSQKIHDKNNIIKSKCKTNIRDISNKEFDSLLKLLDNFEN